MAKDNTCPCCDDSGLLSRVAKHLCGRCRLAALVMAHRRRTNGGQWTAGDMEYFDNVKSRRPVLRRLTPELVEAAEADAVAAQIEAASRRGPGMRRGAR